MDGVKTWLDRGVDWFALGSDYGYMPTYAHQTLNAVRGLSE